MIDSSNSTELFIFCTVSFSVLVRLYTGYCRLLARQTRPTSPLCSLRWRWSASGRISLLIFGKLCQQYSNWYVTGTMWFRLEGLEHHWWFMFFSATVWLCLYVRSFLNGQVNTRQYWFESLHTWLQRLVGSLDMQLVLFVVSISEVFHSVGRLWCEQLTLSSVGSVQGQLKFEKDGINGSTVLNRPQLKVVSSLVGLDEGDIEQFLCFKHTRTSCPVVKESVYL